MVELFHRLHDVNHGADGTMSPDREQSVHGRRVRKVSSALLSIPNYGTEYITLRIVKLGLVSVLRSAEFEYARVDGSSSDPWV
jgi:hypothetical protein